MTFPIPLLRAVTLAIALLAGSAAAHEGHDHGGQADAFPKAGSTPRLESTDHAAQRQNRAGQVLSQ